MLGPRPLFKYIIIVHNKFFNNHCLTEKEIMAFRHDSWRSIPAGSVPTDLNVYQADDSTRKSKPFVKQHTILTETPELMEDPGDMRFECSVCLGEYNESGDGVPRSLVCGHTFCTGKNRLTISSNYIQILYNARTSVVKVLCLHFSYCCCYCL